MKVQCRLKFQCSQQWEDLSPTSDPNVGFCQLCGQNVYKIDPVNPVIVNEEVKCAAIKTSSPETEGESYHLGDLEWVHDFGYTIMLEPTLSLSDEQMVEIQSILKTNVDIVALRRVLACGQERTLASRVTEKEAKQIAAQLKKVGVSFKVFR
jgi:hypothetical protein